MVALGNWQAIKLFNEKEFVSKVTRNHKNSFKFLDCYVRQLSTPKKYSRFETLFSSRVCNRVYNNFSDIKIIPVEIAIEYA